MAIISRLLKIKGLFCRISSLLLGSFAKETYNFEEPTHRSQPILVCVTEQPPPELICAGASVLQCVAVCCSALQCVAVCCSALQCVTVCCSVLQCIAVSSELTFENIFFCFCLQNNPPEFNLRWCKCVAAFCSVLQCVAVCCSVLQCVAVCCSE